MSGKLARRLQVAVVNPKIPNNTGSIGRMCVGWNAGLHLVHPLGFDISEQAVKRAGVQSWEFVRKTEHESRREFGEYIKREFPDPMSTIFISKRSMFGSRPLQDIEVPPTGDVMVVLGNETHGLEQLHADVPDLIPERQCAYIAMGTGVRSFNLASSAAVAMYQVMLTAGLLDEDALQAESLEQGWVAESGRHAGTPLEHNRK